MSDNLRVLPLLERAGEGGAVVVTMFDCGSRWNIVLIWLLHRRIRSRVRARARGFLDIRLYIDWRRRIVRSVSLWADPPSVYNIGDVPEHVAVTRIPPRLGIQTSCGMYTYEGACSAVMFGVIPNPRPNPLTGAQPTQPKGQPG
jgi:hypothetical protein